MQEYIVVSKNQLNTLTHGDRGTLVHPETNGRANCRVEFSGRGLVGGVSFTGEEVLINIQAADQKSLDDFKLAIDPPQKTIEVGCEPTTTSTETPPQTPWVNFVAHTVRFLSGQS